MRELFYFVLYRSREDRTPAGIVVQGTGGLEVPTGHGLIWNHRLGAWQYNPGMADRAVGDEDWDLSDELTREEAERVAPVVTGGEELPDEDTIWWIFQWKGDPPQSEN
jgi:hypothetical protein